MMDPPKNQRRVLGIAYHRLMMKKGFIILLIIAALLLYASLEVSRGVLSGGTRPLASLLYVQTAQRTSGLPVIKGGKIILMTYGRSGSSFTSEIIQQDPDVFYTFEPLYNLIRRFVGQTGKSKVMFPNSTAEMAAYDKESMEIMEVFLTCQFETMNCQDLNNYQLRNSLDSRLLWNCVQRKGNWSLSDHLGCFISARRTCLQHPVRMVKTIRLRGSAARLMMERHPDLKILYLIRDPRGTISSQKRVFGNFKWEELGEFSASYCQTFREDLAEMGRLVERFPQRVKLLRYESMAERPLRESEDMYRFLGLNFTARVRQFVFNKTMAGEKGRNPYSTSRQNSTETATSWRTKITFPAAQTIDQNCRDIYQQLGYLPVNTPEELTDSAYNLRKTVVFHGQQL